MDDQIGFFWGKKAKMKGKLFLVIWFSKSTLNLEMFYIVGSLFRKQ